MKTYTIDRQELQRCALIDALRLAAIQLDEAAAVMSESDFAVQTAENCATRAMEARAVLVACKGGAQ